MNAVRDRWEPGVRENRPVPAIPHIHEAFATLTAMPQFKDLSVALVRNPSDSKDTAIKVYLPTAQTPEQQAEVVSALTNFSAMCKLSTVVEPHGVVLMTSTRGD